ncbi:hypothetical protein D3C75_922840 [compost metagenome]
MGVQLAVKIAQVDLYRVRGQLQVLGNRADRVAAGNQTNHLTLTLRQSRAFRRRAIAFCKALEQVVDESLHLLWQRPTMQQRSQSGTLFDKGAAPALLAGERQHTGQLRHRRIVSSLAIEGHGQQQAQLECTTQTAALPCVLNVWLQRCNGLVETALGDVQAHVGDGWGVDVVGDEKPLRISPVAISIHLSQRLRRRFGATVQRRDTGTLDPH